MALRYSGRIVSCLLFAALVICYLLPSLSTLPRPSEPVVPANTELYNDFDWYQQKHPRPWTSPNETPTPDEHAQRLHRAVQLAKQNAVARLGIEGIRGTRFNTSVEANGMRSLVDCWTRGQWIQSNERLLEHVQDPLYSTCDKKYAKAHPEDSPTGRDAALWAWQPSCPFVDPGLAMTQWCQALKGRNMLLVGDLVHYQLHDMIIDALRQGPKYCFGELNCKDHVLCDEPDSRMRYLRNDVLSTVRRINRADGRPSAHLIQWPFVATNILNAYPILILSRAPVANVDDTGFVEELINTMETLRRSSPNALILYRSASIGHPYCDDATGPLSTPLSDEEQQRLPYGWSDVRRQNAMAREIIEASGGLFLDLAATTDTRPDGHVGGQDCLRYCIPGPLDAWIQILYNVLVALE